MSFELPSWYRRGGCGIKKKERSHLSAADGVVASPKCFVVPDHPVRSFNGGFAKFS
jgi:hypothetical protein